MKAYNSSNLNSKNDSEELLIPFGSDEYDGISISIEELNQKKEADRQARLLKEIKWAEEEAAEREAVLEARRVAWEAESHEPTEAYAGQEIPKWNNKERVQNALAIVQELDIIPLQWALTPLNEKRPYRKDWQKEDPLSREEIAQAIWDGIEKTTNSGYQYISFASGIGVRSGDTAEGLIVLDIDGASAQPLLDRLCGGDLPKSISWKSGKPGRYQIGYQIPDSHREAFEHFTKIALKQIGDLTSEGNEQLEIRYNGCQSCLPPSRHPQTGKYVWVNSPVNTELAIAPQWLLDYVSAYLLSDEGQKATQKKHYAPEGFGNERGDGAIEDAANIVDFANRLISSMSFNDIFCWEGHKWQQFGSTFKGNPFGRESSSGTSFHAWHDGSHWAWQDKLSTNGGGAIQYRWMLKGGEGTPKGKDFFNIIQELADEMGVEIPDFKAKEQADLENNYLQAEEEESLRSGISLRDGDKVLSLNEQFLMSSKESCEAVINHILECHTKGGILALKSATGTGKINVIASLLNLFPDSSTIVVDPTQALCRKHANDLPGVRYREDLEKAGQLENAKRISTCP